MCPGGLFGALSVLVSMVLSAAGIVPVAGPVVQRSANGCVAVASITCSTPMSGPATLVATGPWRLEVTAGSSRRIVLGDAGRTALAFGDTDDVVLSVWGASGGVRGVPSAASLENAAA